MIPERHTYGREIIEFKLEGTTGWLEELDYLLDGS